MIFQPSGARFSERCKSAATQTVGPYFGAFMRNISEPCAGIVNDWSALAVKSACFQRSRTLVPSAMCISLQGSFSCGGGVGPVDDDQRHLSVVERPGVVLDVARLVGAVSFDTQRVLIDGDYFFIEQDGLTSSVMPRTSFPASRGAANIAHKLM